MENTYNFQLSDFFDYVSLSGVEGVDYVVDNHTLYGLRTSDWFKNVDSLITTTKSLCSLNLTELQNLTSITTFDTSLSTLNLPSNNRVDFISAGDLKVTSLSISGSDFFVIALVNSPLLQNLYIENCTKINYLTLVGNSSLNNVLFYPRNFSFNTTSTYNILIGGCNLNNTSCDSLWTSLCAALTGDSPYSSVYVTVYNSVTGLSADTVDYIKNGKGVNVNLYLI